MTSREHGAAADDTLEPGAFRQAMASFPSGVVIATTVDEHGRPWGFTASSFCSVSADPPLILVCLDKHADCHPAFTQAERLAMHVVHHGQRELALRLATRGADKFGGDDFTPDGNGIPALMQAPVRLECTLHSQYEAGDHTVLIARVGAVAFSGHVPTVYYQRAFHPVLRSAQPG